MENRSLFKTAATLALMGASTLTLAQSATPRSADTGWTMPYQRQFWGYAGVSTGASDYHISCVGPGSCDKTDTGLKIFAGGKFNRWLAGELSWVRLGEVRLGGGPSSHAQGINLSLLAGVPLGPVNVNGKVGTTYGWTRIGGSPALGGGREHDFGLSYGANVTYNIVRNVDVRLDWDRYRFDFSRNGTRDVDFFSVGLNLYF
jgi:OOP family OmpA-OmpF porin